MWESAGQSPGTLDAFVHAITEQRDGVEVLYRLAEHVAHTLDAAGAGVSLADPHGLLHPVTGISELSSALADAGSRHRQGPCVEAFRTRSTVAVDDLDDRAETWSGWVREARRWGVRAVIGVPIHARGTWLGGVDAYSLEPRTWRVDEQRRVGLLAGLAASHLLHLSELEQTMQRAEQLQHALDSRVVIEQAKGMLANDFGCTVDEAFEVLRRHARARGANLRTVAHAVVHQRLRPPRLDPSAEAPGSPRRA